jgi:hypothetical protein
MFATFVFTVVPFLSRKAGLGAHIYILNIKIYISTHAHCSGILTASSWVLLMFATLVVTLVLFRFCKAGLEALSDPDSLTTDSDGEAT